MHGRGIAVERTRVRIMLPASGGKPLMPAAYGFRTIIRDFSARRSSELDRNQREASTPSNAARIVVTGVTRGLGKKYRPSVSIR